MPGEWKPIEFRAEEVPEAGSAGIDAVHAVATSEVPAAIVRGACSEAECRTLLARLFDHKLFMGYEEHGKSITGKSPIERFDIGASLGNSGGDPEGFFARSRETNALYAEVFDGLLNPVELLYGYLARLSNGKRANIAHEADGRLYGPAIFRCHMPRWGYPPHIDSVRNRERRTDYAVHRFEHQLGGVLLLQSPEKANGYHDSVLYKCPWTKEVEEMMEIHYLGLDEPERRCSIPKPSRTTSKRSRYPSTRCASRPETCTSSAPTSRTAFPASGVRGRASPSRPSSATRPTTRR